MTKNELKQLIKECLKETLVNEGLPIGNSELAKEAALKLNYIVGKMELPHLQQKARVLAGNLIRLIDEDQNL